MAKFEAMEPLRSKKTASMFSFVIGLIDAYTGDPLTQFETLILLEGVRKKPVRKANGYFVFTDVLPDQYRVHIHSQHYFEESLNIRLNPAQHVVHLQLTPRPSYRFPPGASIIRASLQEQSGSSLRHMQVTARVLSDDCARTRIAQETVAEGSSEILTANMIGKISVGDKYWIKAKTNDETAPDSVEICQIAESFEWMRKLLLTEPLRLEYQRGALLLPVVQTKSDEKGEVVIPFRASPARSFKVELEFHHPTRPHVRQVELQANEVTHLGAIQL